MNPKLKSLTLPLLALVLFNMLPHLWLKPLWSTALGAVFLGYRFVTEIYGIKSPPRAVVWLGGVVVGVGIWQHYHSIFGDEAAGTLLTLLTCLKTYELRFKRDYFFNTLLCFLVLMSYLLIDQSLTMTVFLVTDVILIISYLHALEQESWSWKNLKLNLRPTVGLAIKALPLLVVCFVLFPRFSTGFGTGEHNQAHTGVTDKLKPGSVASLMTSEEVIFRATFLKGFVPPSRSLYWRGAILDESDGLDWSRSQGRNREAPLQLTTAEPDIEIFLEAGSERFIFSLENTRTVSIPSDLNRTRINNRQGRTFELDQPLQNRERYVLENIPNTEIVEPPEKLDHFLETKQEPSREMQELMKQLQGGTSTQTVSNLLTKFRQGGYSYTLQPGKTSGIDDFLFRTKSGFCEHFAGSMATILRYMKIPARVVVGFQGGTPSFLENYITVRAHDAHAWVEYYEPDSKRWRRVDPTAQVAPVGLTAGGNFGAGQQSFILRFRALMDEVEANWIGFLLRFDLAKQKELLAKFGMEETLFRALPVFLLLSIVLILAVLYFFEARGRVKLSKEERLYRDFLLALAKHRVEREPSDGPLSLLDKVRVKGAALEAVVEPILSRLTWARYAGHGLSSTEADILKKDIQSLKKLSIKNASH